MYQYTLYYRAYEDEDYDYAYCHIPTHPRVGQVLKLGRYYYRVTETKSDEIYSQVVLDNQLVKADSIMEGEWS